MKRKKPTPIIVLIYQQNVTRLRLARERQDRNAIAAYQHIVTSMRKRYALGTEVDDAEAADEGAWSVAEG